MYHGIDDRTGARHPYFETNTSPAAFRSQMQVLAEDGYVPVVPDRPFMLQRTLSTAGRPVAITFDDGQADFFDVAVPILVEFGFPAIIYVVTGLTGERRITRDGNNFMSWAEVRELPKYGIRVGSHTLSHPKLYEIDRAQAADEIRRSKEILEDRLGAEVDSFAYPYAFPEHDPNFVAFARDCLHTHGYSNAVTTIVGIMNSQSDPFLLPRLPVNTFDDAALLRAKLEGGYEWLHGLQYAKKLLARRLAS
jgi:peptidoglycan/xylan/chitin deacetylase (PgdA/CDA1 family)